jgi:hypothetical protein
MAVEDEKENDAEQRRVEQQPEVYSVRKGLKDWTFSRRDFLSAAAAAAAAAAVESTGVGQRTQAAPVEILDDPSDAALLNLTPGQFATKTWRLKNTGQAPWGEGAELRLVDAGQMEVPQAIPVPNAGPGEVVAVNIDIVAPTQPGTYQSKWVLSLTNAAPRVVYLPIVAKPRLTPTPTPTPTPSCLAESAHPYRAYADWTWTVVNPDPNARGSRVHFRRIELSSAWINIRDDRDVTYETIYSSAPSGVWSKAVPGRTVKIRLYSYSSSTAWGFCVDKVEAATPPPTPTPTRRPCTCDEVCTCDRIHYWYPN